MRSLVIATVTALFVPACADVATDGADDRLQVSPVEVAAVLELVNDADTTVDFLDHEVGLERRAAQGIIATRNGADGIYPSQDDRAFDSLEELELVKFVGASAMAHLRDYAIDHPAPSGTLVEGVEFTAVENASVLWGVNGALVEELDLDAGLSSTAAQSIVANAPFATMEQLAAAPHVGKATLLALRNYSPMWADISALAGTFDGVAFDGRQAADALEFANHATFETLTAGGMYSTGARAIIGDRPYVDLAEVAATSGVGPSTMSALKFL
jgi:DNA uptake protein ComE-like DNA-binding protein